MKFYKVSLITILIVFLVSGSAVIIGVSYALKVSDRENNTYYSELSYHLIEQQMKRQFERIETALFYDAQYDELKNKALFTVPSNRDNADLIEILKTIAYNANLNYYFYQVDDELTLTNGKEEIVIALLDTLEDAHSDWSLQHHLVFSEGVPYIVFVKRTTPLSDPDSKYLAFYAEASNMINAENINTFVDSNTFIEVEFLETYTPESESGLSFMPFEDGYLDIKNTDYNRLYIPIDNVTDRFISQTRNFKSNETSSTDDSLQTQGKIAQVMVFYTEKPSIISGITRRIMIIVVIILVSFIFFSIIMLRITRRISNHLNHVVNKIDRIANGDYKATVEVSGIVELVDVSNSINKMAKTIDQKISELSDKNEEILKIMIGHLRPLMRIQKAILNA